MKKCLYIALTSFFLFWNTVNNFSNAQENSINKQHFYPEISIGLASCWWAYQKGEDSLSKEVLAWDRTHNTVLFEIDFGLFYQFNRFKTGIVLNRGIFDAQIMRAAENSFVSRKLYLVSEKNIKFLKWAWQIEYDLMKSNKFSLSPNIRYGFFNIETIHPEKENFGEKYFWDLGLSAQYQFKRIRISTRIKRSVSTIVPIHGRPKELHKIYNIGYQFALKYYFIN